MEQENPVFKNLRVFSRSSCFCGIKEADSSKLSSSVVKRDGRVLDFKQYNKFVENQLHRKKSAQQQLRQSRGTCYHVRTFPSTNYLKRNLLFKKPKTAGTSFR